MLRIILDTNVLVSAIIRNGKPRRLMQAGIDDKCCILSSTVILNELSEVLQRPKFKMTRDDVIRIVSALMETVENIHVMSDLKVVKRDPDDDMMINTALDGKADYIVSGDSDLLELKDFRKIKIVSVDRMLKILESQD
jgi:putative PIN family toxin of toxin-antitoxin system